MVSFELVAEGLQFPEGPVATSDGDVLLVEIKRGTLSRVDGRTGEIEVVAECGGGPNGAAVGPDGMVYVCNNGGFEWHERNGLLFTGRQGADYSGGRIQKVDPRSGEVSDLYTVCGEFPLRGPNDIVFDDNGGFWFTDLGKTRRRDLDLGGLYYATYDGSSITEVVHPLVQANGVGLSPDGSRVYVAETGPGRVWAWDLDGPGRIARTGPGPAGAHLMWGFEGWQMLDSLAVDSEGNVCVATLMTGCISVISPEGRLLEQVPVPVPDTMVTNICFGGDDLRTAWVTSSSRGLLYRATWPVPGLRLAHML